MDNIKDILANNEGKLPEEMLLAYLEGKLPPEQQYEVEQWLSEEGMESDAVDGLQQLPHNDTRRTVDRLNHRLKDLTDKKRKRRYIKENPWAWLAITVILLLVVLAYLVIRMAVKK
jgi:anti-sigma factor RsiW